MGRVYNSKIAYTTIPVKTVKNIFFLTIATIKHGIDAKRKELWMVKSKLLLIIKMEGAKREDNIPTGIYFNHFINHFGKSNFVSKNIGRNLGIYVTKVIKKISKM